jgi:hypothetical protein
MTTRSEIPYPRLTQRYVKLKDRASAERLEQATQVTTPQLVEEFLESAEAFSTFSTDDPFFPESRTDDHKNHKSDNRTFGWAMAMKATGRVPVTGDDELTFRYAEREIIPTRTKPGRTFVGGEGKHVRVDLVLANAATGRPIVGELKIASDKDPYTGLVQALAGAAQLVSKSQRRRLSKLNDPSAPTCSRGEPSASSSSPASIEQEPLVDVYVLLGNFPQRGRDRFKQLDRAVKLAAALETDVALADYLGRIRILAVKRDEQGALTVTTELPATKPTLDSGSSAQSDAGSCVSVSVLRDRRRTTGTSPSEGVVTVPAAEPSWRGGFHIDPTSLGSDGAGPSVTSLSDARLPSLPAAARIRNMFLKVEMPPRFVLECLTPDGSWIDWGLYEAATFDREADGTYVSATGVGSPLFIRCLRQDGSVVYVVDGAGEPFTYRLVAFPGGGYSER